MSNEAALARVFKPVHVEQALQLLDDRELDKLALMVGEVHSIIDAAGAGAIVLKTQEECNAAVALIGRGAKALKELEDLRVQRVKPLLDEQRAVNNLFKLLTEPFEALAGKRGRLDAAVMAFRRAEKERQAREAEEARRRQEELLRKQQEALRKAEAAKTEPARQKHLAAAAEAGQQQAYAEADESAARSRAALRGVKTDEGSVTERERWVLLGIHDFDAVPDEYWRADDVVAALQKVLQRAITGGAREIPGCAIGIEESLTRRTV